LLRFKACSPPGKHVIIDSSDQILLSSWENRDHVSASSSMATTLLHVKCCEVPLHQWSLLRHLPCLENLKITDCSDLTYACGSTDLVECISSLEDLTVKDCKSDIVALQERLGDLTSPTGLILSDCNGIKSLLESVQQLRCLRRLVITNCPQGPELVQWCKSEENKIKLAHIREIILDGYFSFDGKQWFADEQSGWAAREQKLENNGGFPKAQDVEALKQWGKYLKLSTYFESSTTKDEMSGARDASHDANALEDLPAQQFSLGNWIGCRQMLPVADPSSAVTGVFSTTPFDISLQSPALPPTTPGSLYTFAATGRPHVPLQSTSRTEYESEADERGSYWIRDWSLQFKEEERNELKKRMQDSGDYCHGTFQQLRLEIQDNIITPR